MSTAMAELASLFGCSGCARWLRDGVDLTGKTILVTGASGLLGRAVLTELKQSTDATVIGLAYSRAGGPHNLLKADLTDAAATQALLDDCQPHVILHCAAERRPDVVATDEERARALNVEVVRRLAAAAEASEQQCWMVALSTDYVFDGDAPAEGYAVDARPNPLNTYGETKLEGERAFRAAHARGTLLRVPVLFGPTDDVAESATTIVAKKVADAAECKGEDDWGVRYPTYTPDVAVVLRQLVEAHFSTGDAVDGETFHWTSNYTLPFTAGCGGRGEPYTKYKIALLMGEILDCSTAHIAPKGAPPADGVRRPRDCHLDRSALEKLGIGRETDFRQALAATLLLAAPTAEEECDTED
eukprot:g522.t1